MWSYSKAAIEPLSYKIITLHFLTTIYRIFFSKATDLIYQYPCWHMTLFRRRYDVYTTSRRLCKKLKRFCLPYGMQLYKTTNSVKSIFLGFSAMVPNSYHVEKVLENNYFAFYICITPFEDCFSLILLIKFIESFTF